MQIKLPKPKIVYFLIILILSFSFVINEVVAISDPSAIYCREMGYKHIINHTEKGDIGLCVFSDDIYEYKETESGLQDRILIKEGVKCNSWDFFEGKCGKEYSYCIKNGYDIGTESSEKSLFSKEYAVCIPTNTKEGTNDIGEKSPSVSVIDLMNLKEKLNQGILKKISKLNGETEELYKDRYKSFSLALPSSFDWRNKDGKNWLTVVKDQEGCGSCWAFSAIGGMESKIKIAKNDSNFDVDLSEQYLVSDCYPSGSCAGGDEGAALNYVELNGITDEPCFSYEAIDNSCSNRCSSWYKRLWKVDDYVPITKLDIKKYLVEKGPLPAGMFYAGYWDGDIFRCDETSPYYPSGPHAIVIVGYNDYGNYWIIKNSWGADWNGDGYFKLGYDECDIGDFGVGYIELKESPLQKINATTLQMATGTKIGSLNDIYYKDGVYLTLKGSCDFWGCSALDATITFPTTLLSNLNITSIDLVGSHNKRFWSGVGSNIKYYDLNNNSWYDFGDVPDSKWSIVKYNICNSKEGCVKYLSSDTNIKYYIPSNFFYNYIDIDWLYLEAKEEILDRYCSASTNNGNEEYITKVTLNGGTKESAGSQYSDFSDTVLTSLNRGEWYFLDIRAHTIANWTEYAKAWIDFNNDGVFDLNEEIDMESATFVGDHDFYGGFSVPVTANLSETRMRVYLKYGSSPSQCENASFGEVEDYTIKIEEDAIPPSVWINGYGATYTAAGESVIVNANVYDESGVSKVLSIIKSHVDSKVRMIELYDDGLHNDGAQYDGIYGNSWKTDLDMKDYSIDINATDTANNSKIYENIDKFTTIPFTSNADILVIDNSRYTSYINYYTDALDSNGYLYNLWNFDLRGSIDNTTLNNYLILVWSSPSFEVPNMEQQELIKSFLDSGKNLFISGQDIGYYLHNTDFYNNYLYSSYIQDDINLYTLNGVDDNIITDNINIQIAGGDGANNQWWPDEIDALSPAIPIFFYDGFSSSKNLILKQVPEYVEKESNKTKSLDLVKGGVVSSGAGAIYLDNDLFRVVYLAFGFEAISNVNDRNLLMDRIIGLLESTTCKDNDNDTYYGYNLNSCQNGTDCNDFNYAINPGTTELCNNQDDNCNGLIDDNLGYTTCGVGACQMTVQNCLNGQQQQCNPGTPIEEICDNGIDDDCDGMVDRDDASDCNLSAFILNVASPIEGITNGRRIPFILQTDIMVDNLTYMDNSEDRPKWITLCKDCNEYGISRVRTKSFRDGEHNLTIKASENGTSVEVNRWVFIDSKDPRIKKTNPGRGKYTNSTFEVQWEELNMKNIILYNQGNQGGGAISRTDCPYNSEKRIQSCLFEVDLTPHNGQEIEYWFSIIDIAGNNATSRAYTVNVDTVSPVLSKLDYEIVGRKVYFDIDVSEEVRLEYMDTLSSIPSWRTLCTRCNSYDGYKYFDYGSNNILVRARDEAENSDVEELNFNV